MADHPAPRPSVSRGDPQERAPTRAMAQTVRGPHDARGETAGAVFAQCGSLRPRRDGAASARVEVRRVLDVRRARSVRSESRPGACRRGDRAVARALRLRIGEAGSAGEGGAVFKPWLAFLTSATHDSGRIERHESIREEYSGWPARRPRDIVGSTQAVAFGSRDAGTLAHTRRQRRGSRLRGGDRLRAPHASSAGTARPAHHAHASSQIVRADGPGAPWVTRGRGLS